MKRLIWVLTGLAVLVWSALAWAAYGLLGWGGHQIAAHADLLPASPEAVEFASWAASFGADVGAWVIGLAWFAVSAVLLAVGFACARFASGLGANRPNVKAESNLSRIQV